MLDRYGESIEADFAHFYNGLDVVDVLRVDDVGGRRKRRMSMRRFRSLVNGLPPHSATQAARADDDEMVHEYMDHLEANPELKKELEAQSKKKPTMYGYTTTDEKLDQVISRLNLVASLLDAQVSKGKNTKNLPGPVVPETAADRWHRKARERRHNDLVAEVRAAQARWKHPKERAKSN